ncbi:PepSY domain-containing protein [Fictibacillus sp. b24]|uniref:PepSY domain-containing protein n=1 Tax=unclassified Fictibacillus TaxID=2644029 RepID=UPI0025A218EF|nr:PepSY domain-containing protein [Fictibacillus sp. b24]MDM5315514.1 PepSY domain-containing protein [Fictibacillus sp. b24]
MNWRNLILAGLTGAAIGYVVTKKQTESITPEKALKLLKEKASEHYSITGAWIIVKPEDANVHGLSYSVYKGGFSHSIPGSEAVHFEFLIDAETGTLLQLAQK